MKLRLKKITEKLGLLHIFFFFAVPKINLSRLHQVKVTDGLRKY